MATSDNASSMSMAGVTTAVEEVGVLVGVDKAENVEYELEYFNGSRVAAAFMEEVIILFKWHWHLVCHLTFILHYLGYYILMDTWLKDVSVGGFMLYIFIPLNPPPHQKPIPGPKVGLYRWQLLCSRNIRA